MNARRLFLLFLVHQDQWDDFTDDYQDEWKWLKENHYICHEIDEDVVIPKLTDKGDMCIGFAVKKADEL